jgi:hypothetical protein
MEKLDGLISGQAVKIGQGKFAALDNTVAFNGVSCATAELK